MSKANTIGSSVWLAHNAFQDAAKVGPNSRNCSNYLVYAVENLIIAVWESENIDRSSARRQTGNHQIDRMIDLLPDLCTARGTLQPLGVLTAYATTFRYASPSGRIPKAPAVTTVQGWLDQTQIAIDMFARHFQVDLRDDEPVAGHTGPFRETRDKDEFEPG